MTISKPKTWPPLSHSVRKHEIQPMTRIGIVYPFSNLDSVPSICNAVDMLAEAGFAVDVFTHRDSQHLVPRFYRAEVKVHAIPTLQRAQVPLNWLHLAIERPTVAQNSSIMPRMHWVRDSAAKIVSPLMERGSRARRMLVSTRTSFALLGEHRHARYSCFIGVDPEGLLLAHAMTRLIRVPILYYSLELLIAGEIRSPDLKKLKAREMRLSRRAPFIIIQDHERAALLVRDDLICPDRFAFVPNSPRGRARRCPSDYWHRKFRLCTSQKVLLHSGAIAPWTGIENIVRSSLSWPEEWVLVIHMRSVTDDAQLNHLRAIADPSRTYFSVSPVPRDEYDSLIDAAHAGIAFYVSDNRSRYSQQNVTSIGLSSGKVAYYLRAGLPVIINRTTSLAALIDSHECGLTVAAADGIGPALARISEDPERFSMNAIRTFDERMQFDSAFEDVIARIREIGGQLR